MKQKFANLYGWTDVRPFEILKETVKTLTIRECWNMCKSERTKMDYYLK